jgi:ketosteroid isomerase-like protein
MVTIDEAEALFTRRRAAWLREDLDGYLDCWADDMTFESPAHRPPIRGRDAYAALVRGSAAVVRPLRFDVLHLAVVGDAVLAEWEIEAEHRATGARLCWRGMSAAGYRDGRIAWWREYWNPADLAPRA